MLFSGASALVATASPAPPNGTNLGLRFVNTTDPILQADAVFLDNDGSTLSRCGSPETPCQFDFTYQINGSTDQEATMSGPPLYDTWPEITDLNVDEDFCWGGQYGNSEQFETLTGPLTNFNCFNQNGFGQMFMPVNSGTLSGFSMALACLAPSGETNFTAYLFEVRMGGEFPLLQNQIATADVTMPTCSTSWSGHAFSDEDFSYPEMDFGDIQLDNTTTYAVLFSGEAVAGVDPVEVSAPVIPETEAAELANTGAHNQEGGRIIGLLLLGMGIIGMATSNVLRKNSTTAN
jgi:hypothetical protein